MLPKLMLTTVFDVSVSNSKEKSLFCFLDSAFSNFVSVEDKKKIDGLMLEEQSFVKYQGKRTALLNRKGCKSLE